MDNNISKPYTTIETKLEELTETSERLEILRKVNQFLKLFNKFKSNLTDLPKASLYLHQIEKLLENNSLRGIQVVDEEVDYLHKQSIEIKSETKQLLLNAIKIGVFLKI